MKKTSISPRGVVFFDRDGTLNSLVNEEESRGPRNCKELKIFHNAQSVTSQLSKAGFLICIVTNQPDISRGLLSSDDDECIKRKFVEEIPDLSGYRVCPHDNQAGCGCRKPKPGLLVDFMAEYELSPKNCWMIGDKWTDVLAGKNAGVRTILLHNLFTFSETSQGKPPPELSADHQIDRLEEVVQIILTDFEIA